MNPRTDRTEHGNQLAEIVRIAGQDVVPQPEGRLDEMTVDDIRRARESQKPTDLRTVIERVHRDCLEKGGQAGLPRTVPSDLRDDRMARMQLCARASDSRDKDACSLIAAVDRDQHPGVKDHSP